MKYISRLLILCLLLVGCAPSKDTPSVTSPPTEAVEVKGLYDPGSSLEISSLGAIRVYPLSPRTGKGLLPFGDGILLFSGGERTTLTLFTKQALVPTARRHLSFSLAPEDCASHGEQLSYYDPENRQTVVLDAKLEEVTVLTAPSGLIGKPVLSPDGSTLYYATSTAIRAWNRDTGIHRIVRQTSHQEQTVTALSFVGNDLRCEAEDRCFFLSPETGQRLAEEDGPLKLVVTETGYLAASWETNLWSMVFQIHGETKALTPRSLSADYFLLADSMSVVTAAAAGEVVTLDHYDLVTGHRTASVMVRGSGVTSVVSAKGALYVLMTLPESDGQSILRWDIKGSPVSDDSIYTGPHYTEENPDLAGLEQCQGYAEDIGSRYGLKILIWQEATALAPEGVTVKPEYRVNILKRELELLDDRLSQFPAGLLQVTASHFDGLSLGLVAQLQGGVQENSLHSFRGQSANLLLAVGDTSEQGLYHQLFHVMQTHILSHSSAFDRWDSLNPQGFAYDCDYAANAIRNSGLYLTESNRYFVDTFSMSYPREDQARIFEYAMLEGKEGVWEGNAMQKKLKAVCRGIRDAYGLSSEERYPWEQYLR